MAAFETSRRRRTWGTAGIVVSCLLLVVIGFPAQYLGIEGRWGRMLVVVGRFELRVSTGPAPLIARRRWEYLHSSTLTYSEVFDRRGFIWGTELVSQLGPISFESNSLPSGGGVRGGRVTVVILESPWAILIPAALLLISLRVRTTTPLEQQQRSSADETNHKTVNPGLDEVHHGHNRPHLAR